jgi:hypothetical protein
MQVLDENAEVTVENPFMGWEGWPPTQIVIVTVVVGIIFEIGFCVAFWNFW